MEELKKNSKFNSHAFRLVFLFLRNYNSNSNIIDSQNSLLSNYSYRLSSNITKLLEHANDLDTLSNMCVALGQKHVQYKVRPRHFDVRDEFQCPGYWYSILMFTFYYQALAGVLVNVVTTQMNIEMSHPIVQAWIKIYGLMSESIKVGLRSVEFEQPWSRKELPDRNPDWVGSKFCNEFM